MTKQEALIVMRRLKSAYPMYTLEAVTLAAYGDELLDMPVEAALSGADAIIRTSKWFPSISELRAAIVELLIDLPKAEDAWWSVYHISKTIPSYPDSGWEPPADFSPIVRKAVSASGGFKAAANDRRQFLEVYGGLRESEFKRLQVGDLGRSLPAGVTAPQLNQMGGA